MASRIGELVDLLQLAPTEHVDAGLAEDWRALSEERGVLPLIRREGAALWLHRRLGVLGIGGGSPLEEALRVQAHHEVVRGLRIDDEASATLRLMRDAGIPVALIKGQARRAATSLYPWADARTLSDVDLLVPGPAGRPAWEVLRAAGYELAVDPKRSYDEHFHLPPLSGTRRVAVEIHTSTSPVIPPDEAWRRATDNADHLTWSELSVVVPSATELLWHAIDHAFAHGNPTRLRSFLDGAVILAAGRPIDWDRIANRLEALEVWEANSQATVSRRTQLVWLATAAMFAKVELPGTLQTRPLPVRRLLRWRQLILNAKLPDEVGERLLDEGSRTELAAPPAVAFPGTRPWRRLRHTVASLLARGGYRTWRLVRPEPAE